MFQLKSVKKNGMKMKRRKGQKKKTKTGGDRTERRNLRFSTILAL